jgi:hypothetical protein
MLIETLLKMMFLFFQKEIRGKSHIPKIKAKPTKKMSRKETRNKMRKLA